MTQRFEIPLKLPNLNDFIDANRINKAAGNKMKQKVQADIGWVIKGARLRKIKKPCFFSFTWYEGHTKRDKDNVAFAKKFIFDRLKQCKVIPDDNNDYVTGFADYFVYGKKWGVIVEITECDEVCKQ